MSLTADLVSLCFREEQDPGHDTRWTPLQDDDFRALALRLDQQSSQGPLWVFAYGSLIWKPEFTSVEMQRATAFGWHRAFCLQISRWRGSPTQPGLMMALERGGQCDGVVYRLPDGDRIAQIERLLRREISSVESMDSVRWLTVMTPSGRCNALVFWAGGTAERMAHRQPLESVAKILASACGHVGSCAEYLFNTVSHLEQLGIRDRNLWRLQALVAEEIRVVHAAALADDKADAVA